MRNLTLFAALVAIRVTAVVVDVTAHRTHGAAHVTIRVTAVIVGVISNGNRVVILQSAGGAGVGHHTRANTGGGGGGHAVVPGVMVACIGIDDVTGQVAEIPVLGLVGDIVVQSDSAVVGAAGYGQHRVVQTLQLKGVLIASYGHHVENGGGVTFALVIHLQGVAVIRDAVAAPVNVQHAVGQACRPNIVGTVTQVLHNEMLILGSHIDLPRHHLGGVGILTAVHVHKQGGIARVLDHKGLFPHRLADGIGQFNGRRGRRVTSVPSIRISYTTISIYKARQLIPRIGSCSNTAVNIIIAIRDRHAIIIRTDYCHRMSIASRRFLRAQMRCRSTSQQF